VWGIYLSIYLSSEQSKVKQSNLKKESRLPPFKFKHVEWHC
jgi:hypothetical protein